MGLGGLPVHRTGNTGTGAEGTDRGPAPHNDSRNSSSRPTTDDTCPSGTLRRQHRKGQGKVQSSRVADLRTPVAPWIPVASDGGPVAKVRGIRQLKLGNRHCSRRVRPRRMSGWSSAATRGQTRPEAVVLALDAFRRTVHHQVLFQT